MDNLIENTLKESCRHGANQQKIGTGESNGSFGELMQGLIPTYSGLKHFLVTLPIDSYSRATVVLTEDSRKIVLEPAHKIKSAKFAQKVLDKYKPGIGAYIYLNSDMEEGKGLSSSTADLVALCSALGNSLEIEIPPEVICNIIKEIEPTDGLMYSGCVSFYHREVNLRSKMGSLPKYTLIAIDEGGSIDTVEYNKRLAPRSVTEAEKYENLLNTLENAIQMQDVMEIGKVATTSALMNQKYNEKKYFEQLTNISAEVGLCGVVVAHSGTMLALMLANDDPLYTSKLDHSIEMIKSLDKEIKTYKTI